MTSTDTNPVDFSVAEFAAWVATKPAGEAYCYNDICGCAFFQFLRAQGAPVLMAGGAGYWVDTDSKDHNENIPFDVLANTPWTFGALATRLEALVPETPAPKPSAWTQPTAYLSDRVRIVANA